jgi:uncharacterized protein (DUF1501 family)
MQRRDLLKALSAGALCAVNSRLFAAPAASENRFLLVFLRGGYDASNLLVPVSSSFYYEARPNIAIPRPGNDANTAISLNTDWGLHPALRESLYPLYQQKQLAFIPFAGTDDLTRSHFETQDSIELGQNINGSRDYNSGFMNRLVAQLGATEAMAFTDQLPIALRGKLTIANTSLRNVGKSSMDPRQTAIIEKMYGNTKLAEQVNSGFAVKQEVMQEMADEMNNASRNAISSKGFELEARRIAKMMRDKYSIGFVDVGGWDTHVNQGAAKGALAGKLEELGRGLAAYANEMGDSWNNTVVVVLSEFGRTFRENGKLGTDHGHGSVYWVLGGGIQGGKIAGEQTRIDQPHLFQNRDYPVLNEYRSVLAGLFARQFGMNSKQLDQVFSGVKARDIGLL